MNASTPNRRILTATLALLTVGACTVAPSRPDGASAVRTKLTQLQADPQLAGRAPVAMKDAEAAVRTAELPTDDVALGNHRVVVADRKVDTARAQAQTRFAEDQRKGIGEQRETARLDSRTREVDSARRDAEQARSDAADARNETASARLDTESARIDTAMAQEEAANLQRQLAELNARTTDRGFVVTLGDVLFTSGRSALKGGTPGNLDKLAAFLTQYPDRTVLIEGHTDSVGSDDSNLGLSQRRADAVKAYLVAQGIAPARLSASGMGEGSPAADNDSVTGRQQNRRVEVIISNTVASLQ